MEIGNLGDTPEKKPRIDVPDTFMGQPVDGALSAFEKEQARLREEQRKMEEAERKNEREKAEKEEQIRRDNMQRFGGYLSPKPKSPSPSVPGDNSLEKLISKEIEKVDKDIKKDIGKIMGIDKEIKKDDMGYYIDLAGKNYDKKKNTENQKKYKIIDYFSKKISGLYKKNRNFDDYLGDK
jgi:hypothetical protein